MSATAEGQERWREWYEKASKGSDRDNAGKMIQRADARALWQTVFMIGSIAGLVGMMTFFYDVLSR